MHHKLARLLNKFLIIETIIHGHRDTYIGKLIDLDQEAFEMQGYEDDGSEAGRWTGLIRNITAIKTKGADLDKLSCEAKYKQAVDSEEVEVRNEH